MPSFINGWLKILHSGLRVNTLSTKNCSRILALHTHPGKAFRTLYSSYSTIKSSYSLTCPTFPSQTLLTPHFWRLFVNHGQNRVLCALKAHKKFGPVPACFWCWPTIYFYGIVTLPFSIVASVFPTTNINLTGLQFLIFFLQTSMNSRAHVPFPNVKK